MSKQCTLLLESIADPSQQHFHGAYTMWIKSARGFDDSQHCAKCLLGEFIAIRQAGHWSEPYELGREYRFKLDSIGLDSMESGAHDSADNAKTGGFGSARLESPRLIDGEILHYFCIVATPYEWSANIHAPFIYQAGAQIVREFKGQRITLSNALEIPFDDSKVRAHYAHKDAEFTTCRNFQFGAYYYG